MNTILLGILLAATPSLFALLWLSWHARIFDAKPKVSAPPSGQQKRRDAVVVLGADSASEFPIAPHAGSAAPVRQPRRRAATRVIG